MTVCPTCRRAAWKSALGLSLVRTSGSLAHQVCHQPLGLTSSLGTCTPWFLYIIAVYFSVFKYRMRDVTIDNYLTCMCAVLRDRQTERETERQKQRWHRQISRWAGGERGRQSDKQGDRQTDRETDRQGDRQSDRQTDRVRDRV